MRVAFGMGSARSLWIEFSDYWFIEFLQMAATLRIVIDGYCESQGRTVILAMSVRDVEASFLDRHSSYIAEFW